MGSSPCRCGPTVSVGSCNLATANTVQGGTGEVLTRCGSRVVWEKLTSRWKCDCGSPQYHIFLAEAPFLMLGREEGGGTLVNTPDQIAFDSQPFASHQRSLTLLLHPQSSYNESEHIDLLSPSSHNQSLHTHTSSPHITILTNTHTMVVTS